MLQTNRLLIQVVAQLKPERCGVSDHAIRLAQELQTAFRINTAFVVLNSTEPCDIPFPRVYCETPQLFETCNSLSKGHSGALLVHCSGYGYSRDGAPLNLAEAIERVQNSGQLRIATYFHELFAVGMPWKSAFWHMRRQKQAIRRLARASDLIATNSSRHGDWLVREAIQGGGTPVRVLPMFSNVGESLETPHLVDRRSAMVVFGLADTRQKAYRRLSTLGNLLHTLGIEEIIDVGPEFDARADVNGVPVRRMGVLTAPDLADTLSRSMFGFVQHEPSSLAKSGVFAGLCALGTIPVIAEPFSGEVDGLTDGAQVVSPATAGAVIAGGPERCSAAAWHWYSAHRLHAHAAEYSAWMDQSASKAARL